MPVNYFAEETDFYLPSPEQHSSWIISIIRSGGKSAGEINYIFCSDDYLLNINREYLQHDYFTDIITFDNSESSDIISGDLFISIDRVKENARSIAADESDELDRVMVHGILHLLGHGDKTEKEKEEIRKKEDHCLSLRSF